VRTARPRGAAPAPLWTALVLGAAALFLIVAVLTLRRVEVSAAPTPLVVPQLPDRSHNVDGGGELVDDQPEEPAAAPVSIGGIPEQLDRRQLEAAMVKVKPAVLHCRGLNAWGGYAGELSVRMTIASSGALSQAVILGVPPEETHTALADCVLHAIHGISFPRFRGALHPTMEWTYPFVLRD